MEIGSFNRAIEGHADENVRYKKEDFRRRSTYAPNNVQAFISNIVFPKTLEGVLFYAKEHGCFNVEDILNDTITTWTVPTWAKVGDVVLFMHSKTSISTITALKTKLYQNKSDLPNDEFQTLDLWIERGRRLYQKYGGTIFAIGKVVGAPSYIANNDPDYEDASAYHWKSKIYADIELTVLTNPVHVSQFNQFIRISRQGTFTGVWGNDFTELRTIICRTNNIPEYYRKCDSCGMPISRITKENWMRIGNEYRRCFIFEEQFRKFYVDYLLRDLGAQKKIFSECRCKKRGFPDTFADNVILFGKKFLPVEVKLSVPAQSNLKKQVSQYCNTDSIVIDRESNRSIGPKNLYNHHVLVIDTDNIYLYEDLSDTLDLLFPLDDITNWDSLTSLRHRLLARINQA